MNRNGEIIIIEDDIDDQELFAEVFKNLNFPNKVLFYSDAEIALAHLEDSTTEPFLILSDINLPKLSGLELRERVFTNKKLSQQCIPYIFFTTSASKKSVVTAYAASAQGFFTKPNEFNELEETLKLIIDYWKKCYSPSDFATNTE